MKARWVYPLAGGAAYLLLTLGMLWPLPRELGRSVPGLEFDIWQNTWNLWWVRHCLWQGQGTLFYTHLLYYPGGASLLFHTLSLTNTILALPVTILWGPVAAYGLVALFSYVVGGIGAALLVTGVLGDRPGLSGAARWGAAFLGGAAFTFSSYHFAHLRAHLHMLSLEWLPLYAWAMLRCWKKPGLGRIAVAVVFLLLTSWTDWYYCLYALLLTGLFLLVQLAQRRFSGKEVWAAGGRIALVVVASLAVLAVQWVPMVREQAGDPAVRMSPAYAVQLSADPLAYFTPGPFHPLWGQWTLPLYRRYSSGNLAENGLYLGLIPLTLAVLGVRKRWAGRPFWVSAVLLFGLLSLGPVLQFGGNIVTVNGSRVFMPYALLHLLPLLDIARVPARFGLLVTLATAVLAGAGLAGLLQDHLHGESRRLLVSGLLTLLLCAELAGVPCPVTPARVPSFYYQLASDSGGEALLELPIVQYPEEHTERLLYQTVHGHPIFGGYISRGDPHLPYEQIPGFRAFQALVVRREITEPDLQSWREQARAALHYYGAGYIVLQRPALSPGRLQAAEGLARALLGPPMYSDAETSAYRVPAAAGAFWELGEGWGSWTWREGPARLVKAQAGLRLVLPGGGQGQVCLRAGAAEGTAALSVAVDGQALRQLPIDPVAAVACVETQALSAGTHAVILQKASGAAVWIYAVWLLQAPTIPAQ